MSYTLSTLQTEDNSIISVGTTAAILEAYQREHGPCTEERLEAVCYAAAHAAISLTFFKLTMEGSVVPFITNGELGFDAALSGSSCGAWRETVQRVVKEVMR